MIEYGILRDRDGIYFCMVAATDVRRYGREFDAKFRELFGRTPMSMIWSDRVITAGPITELEASGAAEKLRREQR